MKDVGTFAAAAFADPERFNGHEIDLSAETFKLPEVAAKITKATGKQVSAVTLSKEEALAKPYGELGYRHETWNNVEGYKVDLDAVRSWGISLTSLDQFIEQNPCARQRPKLVVRPLLHPTRPRPAMGSHSAVRGCVRACTAIP
ncbi:NmrA family NAD(P)-binding protein [Neorhizobium vignae]|uniref:NmrA family NAD(P)-binding protein n=1 Tax=Neorhizobium vignae TaxID=690585 RepID=UPI00138E1BD8